MITELPGELFIYFYHYYCASRWYYESGMCVQKSDGDGDIVRGKIASFFTMIRCNINLVCVFKFLFATSFFHVRLFSFKDSPVHPYFCHRICTQNSAPAEIAHDFSDAHKNSDNHHYPYYRHYSPVGKKESKILNFDMKLQMNHYFPAQHGWKINWKDKKWRNARSILD